MYNNDLTNKLDNRGDVSIKTDGVKTYKQLLDLLFGSVDLSKVSARTSSLVIGGTMFKASILYSASAIFSNVEVRSNTVINRSITLENNASTYYSANLGNDTYTDLSATVPAADKWIILYY